VFGVWCLVFGVWCLGFEIFNQITFSSLFSIAT
jgi:hypothetical protein